MAITVTNTIAYRYYAFKFSDNWGDASFMAVRRIILQFLTNSATSHYPPDFTGTYVLENQPYFGAIEASLSFNPANSLIGTWSSMAWKTGPDPGKVTNNVLNIDLGDSYIINRIYYENSHNSGAITNTGVQNFTFWGSNSSSSFSNTDYSTDTGWTQITASQSTFDIHITANFPDAKIINLTNSSSYRYYRIKCADTWGATDYMGLRRVELQFDSSLTSESQNAMFFAGD